MRSTVDGVTKVKETFTGKEQDAESNFYYFGARFYDPAVGRWLSVDPLAGNFPSLTPYNYVYNNPVNVFDPNGEAGFAQIEVRKAKALFYKVGGFTGSIAVGAMADNKGIQGYMTISFGLSIGEASSWGIGVGGYPGVPNEMAEGHGFAVGEVSALTRPLEYNATAMHTSIGFIPTSIGGTAGFGGNTVGGAVYFEYSVTKLLTGKITAKELLDILVSAIVKYGIASGDNAKKIANEIITKAQDEHEKENDEDEEDDSEEESNSSLNSTVFERYDASSTSPN